MRRLFPAVPPSSSSSPSSHVHRPPRRLSSPPSLVAECHASHRGTPRRRIITDPANTRGRPSSLARAHLTSETTIYYQLQHALFHCASSRILCKTENRGSLCYAVNLDAWMNFL